MAGAQLGAALRQIQQLFSEGSSLGLSDTQLLAGFAARRDEAAFAALVARHGPMVLAVCRGILRDPHEAEDAYQATFVVLARKADSAWAEGQLGGWLHKVACRIALRARVDATRRRALERRAAEEAAVESTCDPLEDDLRPALHEEVARLPADLRLPVMLCYLQGLTHAQAADALRCGEATVRRRLAGARERLRLRLVRRGFEPSAAALGEVLAKEAGAAVAPVCAEATARAAIRVAAGEAAAAVVGTRVALLSRGGMNLAMHGRNMVVCVLLAVGAAVSVAAGITAGSGQSDKRAADRTNPPLPAKPIQSSAERSAVVEKPVPALAPAVLKTITNTIGMELVLIPEGEFLMGSPDSDTDASAVQKPQHRVRVTRAFFLGVTEVTQGQYQAVTGANPSLFKGSRDLPVERVSWLDAIDYCNALSRKEGLTAFYRVRGETVEVPDWNGTGYRLPTEVEWEYACRAGSTTRYSFGDLAAGLGAFAWYSGNSRTNVGTFQNVLQSHPVGQKQPNAWGLHDMLGNVEEWCWDGYEADYYSKNPPTADPLGPSQAASRVTRGGCWRLSPQHCRSAFRAGHAPGDRSGLLGFRVVRVRSGP